jgi:hypothetical protein
VEKIMTYYKANCTTFTDEIFMLLNPKHGVWQLRSVKYVNTTFQNIILYNTLR